ncbi:Uncharacterized protein DAT39_019013 [Clarias magur]|uniref:Uncharacterized protein n=1 Tax=Clarias magur TaxID=1594786 RepID=A0A8J4U1R7_CLAMG|nr:Uncharacterized protein DAT39_019013 [Clarias magur]
MLRSRRASNPEPRVCSCHKGALLPCLIRTRTQGLSQPQTIPKMSLEGKTTASEVMLSEPSLFIIPQQQVVLFLSSGPVVFLRWQ